MKKFLLLFILLNLLLSVYYPDGARHCVRARLTRS